MLMATQHTSTPTLSVRDNRGQVVRTLNYNRRTAEEPAVTLPERQLTSDDGRHSRRWDARLFGLWQDDETVTPNAHTRSSLTAQVLRSDSVDAGWQVLLYDAAGRAVWTLNGRGTVLRTGFDLLGRKQTVWLQEEGGAERVAERFIYGDTDSSLADAAGDNARGQMVRHYHDAGLQAVPGYSLAGAALREQCRLLPGAEAVGNWQGENESAWQDALAPTVYATGHEYDALGGVLGLSDAGGNRQSWSYDVAGKLSQAGLTLSGGSEQTLLSQQSWSAAGQKLEETAGNGVVTTYRYAPETQWLTGIRTVRADQTVLQDLSYGYDPVGNVLWQDNTAAPTRYFANQSVRARQDYQYDAMYQLVGASGRENANAGVQGPGLPAPMPDMSNLVNYTRSYTYDNGGNLLRIQHSGAQSYSNEIVVSHRSNRGIAQDKNVPIDPTQVDGYFDASGNVGWMQPGQPLGWNERNQLQRVVLVNRGGVVSDSDREVYQYRNGQRVRKQGRRLIDADSQRWDVEEVIYLPGLELRTRYVEQAGQALAPDEVLAVSTPSQGGRAQVRVLHWDAGQPADIPNDQVRYGQGDQLGSLQLELDAAGQVISQEEYYPFGGTAVLAARSEVEVSLKVVRYSGKERDGTGLYYYGYRYYAPWLGRWLNPDPAGLMDGLNLYRMVRNNPKTFLDDSGLAPIPLINFSELEHTVLSDGLRGEIPEATEYITVPDGELSLRNVAYDTMWTTKWLLGSGAGNQINDIFANENFPANSINVVRNWGETTMQRALSTIIAGTGFCDEHARIGLHLLYAHQSQKPSFLAHIPGHAFALLGDPRVEDPLLVDGWVTVPTVLKYSESLYSHYDGPVLDKGLPPAPEGAKDPAEVLTEEGRQYMTGQMQGSLQPEVLDLDLFSLELILENSVSPWIFRQTSAASNANRMPVNLTSNDAVDNVPTEFVDWIETGYRSSAAMDIRKYGRQMT